MARIDVCDDDRDFIDLITAALGDEGWIVVPRFDPEEAVTSLLADSPDVVLLDIHFGGGLGGWAIAERIVDDPALTGTQLVMCTGDAGEIEKRRTWLAEHGILALPKPFDLEELDGVTGEALALARKRQTNGPT